MNIYRETELLYPTERQALIEIGRGEHNPGWPVFTLIYKGYVTQRRRWWLFGSKEVRLTKKGRQVLAVLEATRHDRP